VSHFTVSPFSFLHFSPFAFLSFFRGRHARVSRTCLAPFSFLFRPPFDCLRPAGPFFMLSLLLQLPVQDLFYVLVRGSVSAFRVAAHLFVPGPLVTPIPSKVLILVPCFYRSWLAVFSLWPRSFFFQLEIFFPDDSNPTLARIINNALAYRHFPFLFRQTSSDSHGPDVSHFFSYFLFHSAVADPSLPEERPGHSFPSRVIFLLRSVPANGDTRPSRHPFFFILSHPDLEAAF